MGFFSRRRKPVIPVQPSKKAALLNIYLTSGMAMLSISEKLSNPANRAGVQVFILGMADMVRQVEKLSLIDFVSIYGSVLREHNLLPRIPIEDFVKSVGSIASTNDEVAGVMRQGADSIRAYMAEQDADAPTDLLLAVSIVEKNESRFSEIPR